MTTGADMKNSKSGQAIIEFVPAMVLFFIVLSAGFSYYRLMRSAQIREEAVRNVIFQKINYSGTLTSTFVDASRAAERSIFLGDGALANPTEVLERASCIGAVPNGLRKEVGDRTIASMVDNLPTFDLVTYAVIYRFPGGPPCTP